MHCRAEDGSRKRLPLASSKTDARAFCKPMFNVFQTYEVWNWDPDQRSSDLFKVKFGPSFCTGAPESLMFQAFISHHYLQKALNSGFPPGVSSEVEKEAYALRLSEQLGLHVSAAAFSSNAPKRSLSKLIINQICKPFSP